MQALKDNVTLMNKNHPILEIDLDGGQILSTGKILNETMLPIQLQDGFTLETINKWFMGRRIPDKRDGLKEARMLFRGFEKETYYFSLSVSYCTYSVKCAGNT